MTQTFWQSVKEKLRAWRSGFVKTVNAILAHPTATLIFARLSEKTTWLAMASVASTWGIVLAPDHLDLIFTTVIGVSGFVLALWNTITLPTYVDGGAVKAGVKDSVAAGVAPEEAMAVGLAVAEDVGATRET